MLYQIGDYVVQTNDIVFAGSDGGDIVIRFRTGDQIQMSPDKESIEQIKNIPTSDYIERVYGRASKD